jgi:threonine aldolase
VISPTNSSTTQPIELRSDNAAGAAVEILHAVAAANSGSALAYGADDWSAQLQRRVSDVFEHPDAVVIPVVTGTAANALGLSAICPPWGAVLCHETAHILRSECGATSLLCGGAVMRGVTGESYKLSAAGLADAFAATRWGDNHHSQPSVLSFTQPTDFGTIYSVAEIAELASSAHERGLRVHLDGARIANAIVALGCSPAELTWRAGIDVFSLGATKNGAVTTDAIVCFDPAIAAELHYRVKRSGHVPSKMRFQSAQLEAYLADGLWLRLAAQANSAMARLAAGLRHLGVELLAEPDVNMLFGRVSPATLERMESAGLLFYAMGADIFRFVTSFETTLVEVDEVLSRMADAVAG